jgi:hypothetical protein
VVGEGTYVPRPAVNRDAHHLSIFGDVPVFKRQQHHVIDLAAQAAHDALQFEKIKDELVCGIELTGGPRCAR